MRMLDDRLNYGLFLDFYLSNLLMDSFLKEGNHRGKSASFMERNNLIKLSI